jgi:hypothetical protein
MCTLGRRVVLRPRLASFQHLLTRLTRSVNMVRICPRGPELWQAGVH